MAPDVKENLDAPPSSRFRLPSDLDRLFYEQISNTPDHPSYPAIFSRILISHMEENEFLSPFLGTAESYLHQKIRQFFKQVAGLDKIRWSKMPKEAFFTIFILPHLNALQFILRDAFHYLEAQVEHGERLRATMQLLDDAEVTHGELAETIEGYRKRVAELSSEASTDTLTGLQNRKVLDRMCAKYSKEMPEEPFAYIIMDMDKFKIVNDTLGHIAGDQAIQQLAALISTRAGVRYDDVVRLGGEEFVILMRNNDGRGEKVAKKIREIIEEHVFELQDNNRQDVKLKKTISVGLCHCVGKELANNAAYSKADRALQLAKGSQFTSDGLKREGEEDIDGRNRVWIYGRSHAEYRESDDEDTFNGR